MDKKEAVQLISQMVVSAADYYVNEKTFCRKVWKVLMDVYRLAKGEEIYENEN